MRDDTIYIKKETLGDDSQAYNIHIQGVVLHCCSHEHANDLANTLLVGTVDFIDIEDLSG